MRQQHIDGMTSRERDSASLLAAKLAVAPPPVPLVARPRLIRLVTDAVATPVTLVSAPAGWGKTALLSSWARSRPPGTTSWLTVDADDRGARLRRYLAAALGCPGPEPDRAWAGNGTGLLDRIAVELTGRAEPVVLVLDDLHRLVDADLFHDLDFLLRHAGDRLRLVLSTRVDPPRGLPRWRVRGELVELRAGELACTVGEAVDLFAAHGTRLSDEQARRLWARTEGWPAGLRLAALALRGQAGTAGRADPTDPLPELADVDVSRFVAEFTGEHPMVADYLTQEVLTGIPEQAREVLRRVALPEWVPAELVPVLAGRPDGERLLTEAARNCGFITVLPGTPAGWRYHPFVRELLHGELRTRDPRQLRVLQQQAATWYAAHGQPVPALRHALATGDRSLVGAVFLAHWPELIPYGRGALGGPHPAYRGEVADPGDDPVPMLACAADRLREGDLPGADHWLRSVGPAVGGDRTGQPARLALIADGLDLARAELADDPIGVRQAAERLLHHAGTPQVAAGDRRAAAALGRTALGALRLGVGDLTGARRELTIGRRRAERAGVSRVRLVCAGRLALLAAVRGQLVAAERSAEEALTPGAGRWAGAADREAGTGHARLALAIVALHRDRSEEAESLLSAAGPVTGPAIEPGAAALSELVRAELLADRGEPVAAVEALRAGRRYVADRPEADWLRHQLVAAEAGIRAGQADPGGAAELLRAAWPAEASSGVPAGSSGRPPTPPPVWAVTLAGIELLTGDVRAAERTLPDWQQPDAAAWPLPVRLAAGLLDALIAERGGDRRRAGQSLEWVLQRAEPDGYRRVFTHAQPPVRELLTAHLDSGTACWPLVNDLVHRLRPPKEPGRPERSAPVMAEPLTERELTVLRYLQSILSNVEIAGELSLSVNTVKTHVRNIYRKLDATRRREAVRRARELHLL